MTPLDWLLLSLVAGLSLALWRVIVLRAEDRRDNLAERLRLNNSIADDAVELLRLRSLVRAVDGAQAVAMFGVDVQKDGVKIVGYNAAGEPVYEWPHA